MAQSLGDWMASQLALAATSFTTTLQPLAESVPGRYKMTVTPNNGQAATTWRIAGDAVYSYGDLSPAP